MKEQLVARWYSDWCEPIVLALYKRDAIQIRKALDIANQILLSGELSDSDTACLSYQLAYLEFQAQTILQEPGWTKETDRVYVNRLAIESSFHQAEQLRRRLYFQLRLNLDRRNKLDLHLEDFRELFQSIPEGEMINELWMFISTWAFRHRNIEYLEKAYEFSIFNAKGFYVDWSWQKIHLMLKLTRQDCTKFDIEWIIDKAAIAQQLKFIKNLLWPRAAELGLIDERLELKLMEREIEFAEQSDANVIKHFKPYITNTSSKNLH